MVMADKGSFSRIHLEGLHRVVLGLSGGADSVALLLLLLERGVEVVVAHCNFGLRGKESDRDETFVRDLCARKGVKLHVRHFDTRGEARLRGESIEMAARRLRYAWFEELRKKEDAEAVCTAHHRDDNVETFLLNLLRGSGLDGLTGMPADTFAQHEEERERRPRLIRPLLHTSRAELEDFLKSKGQGYVVDSTNTETLYRRNKIRHEVLPLLRGMNPAIDRTLAETVERLRQAQYFYHQGIARDLAAMLRKADGIASLPVKALRAHPAALTLLHHALADEFPAVLHGQIADLIDAQPGKHVRHGNMMAVRSHDAIEWGSTDEPLLPESVCTIDADKVVGSLQPLRPFHDGERFRPLGLRGTKLVNDYLADRHVSLLRRKKARVLCDEAGIVWVVGYEIDQRVAVTSSTNHKQTFNSKEL